MFILTLSQIKERLQGRSTRKVAEEVGLSHSTIHNLQTGEAKNATLSTIKKVSDYLLEEE